MAYAAWYREWCRKHNPHPYYRSRAKNAPQYALAVAVCLALATIAVFVASCSTIAFGAEMPQIDENTAIQCLLGEARGEGYAGMLAVAEVLRRRGNTQGMYGCTAKIKDDEMAYMTIKGVIAKAHLAWIDSQYTNTTNGATLFENIEKFGLPKWYKCAEKTVKIGNQTFFKEIKKCSD